MNGHHSVGKPGEGNFERMTFAQMRLQVPDPTLVRSRYSIDARPWSELWAARDQPRFRAEIEWRIALPVSVLVLTLLALPLGLMPPRSGRYARLPVAILVYALYANFLIVGKSWLADGQSPPGLGLWWAHALPLLLWAWWAWRQRFFVVWSRQRIRMPR
jgi:lipopolysaccharide export system permease protein